MAADLPDIEYRAARFVVATVGTALVSTLLFLMTGPIEQFNLDGQYFGELGALFRYPRSAPAPAASNVTLTAYGLHTFREAILSR